MAILQFKPICQQRVWGGRDIEDILLKKLPDQGPYGESWEIVDRPEAQSVVVGGEYDNLNIRKLLEKHGVYVMGPNWNPAIPFPVLVKWLDCKDRLSLQVHPPASVADELKGEPKTEAWYIVSCSNDAHLIAGMKKGATREQFESALKNNEPDELEPLCHRFKVKEGDHIFIPSGRIHAIDAGNLILEIQQNSDTTYRVFDWGRVGLDGTPRQLHIEESMTSIDFDDFEPTHGTAQEGEVIVADCNEFRIRKCDIAAGEILSFEANEEARLIGVVQGAFESTCGSTLKFGDNALLPYGDATELKAKTDTTVLITDHFA